MNPAPSIRPRGFTLLELLIAMSIMTILLTMAVPATRSVLDSFHITQALNVTLGVLDEARERAVSLNRPVQVWICRAADSSQCRTLQVISREPDGTLKRVNRAVELPAGTCIAPNVTWSSLMTLAETAAGAASPPVGSLGANYAYRQITFYPSGSTNLDPSAKWCLSILSERDEKQSTLPRNFATVQIDPVNGQRIAYRP